jgi:hypothetical protein
MPDVFHTNGQVAHHRMNEHPPKAKEKWCEFCERPFNDPSYLNRRLKKYHAMKFANSISKYYSIATKLATPKCSSSFALDENHRFGD